MLGKDARLAVTGAPDNGSTRGAVTLTAEQEAVWTVEGKYTVKAVDMAGNESEVSFEIDRTKPAFTASVPSGQPTGQDITLT
ncbi:MAG: hypothetical protein ACLSAP_09765, partial [Oscillospiraceae bacterium]